MIARKQISVMILFILLTFSAAVSCFERSYLTIDTTVGEFIFEVEIAETKEQLLLGLMHRPRLPIDSGMLFDYKTPQVVAMWMKNTLIPLDLLFIDNYGSIVNIRQRAVPESLEAISSEVSVRAVLELNGGTVTRLNINIGDRVRHEIFNNKISG